MDRNNPYTRQVELLVQILPFVFQEECFALKGGTAINLFVRDMPRLSVDIDLVYLPDGNREQALKAVHDALDRISVTLQGAWPDATVVKSYEQKPDALRLVISRGDATVKIELSPVLRGTVDAPLAMTVLPAVEDAFGFAQAKVVSTADLYAGKLCAALDRQHPRDLFDVLLLLENEGITDDIRRAFLIYLISHPRPMEELLAPQWKSMEGLFDGEFQGMTEREVSMDELAVAGRTALSILLSQMTEHEKHFLCSLYDPPPDWALIESPRAAALPAVQWKLQNINRMSQEKRLASKAALHAILFPPH